MRTLATCLIGATFGAAALAGGDDCKPPAHSTSDGKLIVHEWGTFTSFAGSDGIAIDFRSYIGLDLPDFVYDRREWTGDGSNIVIEPDKFGLVARQRMETPVIYFYADKPRTVDVKVDFPAGLLTEFYPAVHAMKPAYNASTPEPLWHSHLHWQNIRIVPTNQLSASGERGELGHAPSLPPVAANDPYGHARDTASAWVRVCRGDRDEFEKFLFYRGVGNFKLPVSARADAAGRITLKNEFRRPLSAVFVIEDICCGTSDVQFAAYSDVSGETVLSHPLKTTSVHEVGEAIARALVRTGLYELEARAMVKTWSDSWLTESGRRVLYLVPPEITDEVLPLAISPKPDELVRVLVGRLELLGAGAEAELAAAIRTLTTDPAADAALTKLAIQKFGRFAEPALRRAAAMTENPALRARAEELVKSMAKPKSPAR